MKQHLCPLLLLIYFAFSSRESGIDAMGNWWEKPSIFHGVGDKIRWESDGKKYPYFGGKYGYQFPRLSQFDGFRCIFQCYGKFMGKPKHFPCDEVSYRMGIWLSKCTPTMGKVWVPISQAFPGFCYIFPCYEKLMGKHMYFSYDEIYNWVRILWKKSTHAMVKVWELISEALPILWFLLNFPMLLEII